MVQIEQHTDTYEHHNTLLEAHRDSKVVFIHFQLLPLLQETLNNWLCTRGLQRERGEGEIKCTHFCDLLYVVPTTSYHLLIPSISTKPPFFLSPSFSLALSFTLLLSPSFSLYYFFVPPSFPLSIPSHLYYQYFSPLSPLPFLPRTVNLPLW